MKNYLELNKMWVTYEIFKERMCCRLEKTLCLVIHDFFSRCTGKRFTWSETSQNLIKFILKNINILNTNIILPPFHIIFAEMDVSRLISMLNTSISTMINMKWKMYNFIKFDFSKFYMSRASCWPSDHMRLVLWFFLFASLQPNIATWSFAIASIPLLQIICHNITFVAMRYKNKV